MADARHEYVRELALERNLHLQNGDPLAPLAKDILQVSDELLRLKVAAEPGMIRAFGELMVREDDCRCCCE